MKTSDRAFSLKEVDMPHAGRAMLKHHKGSMTVKICLGKGTTSNFILPLAHEEEQREREDKPLGAFRGSETILLAEDDSAVRNLIGLILRERGYSVIEAADGNEAVRHFTDHKSAIDLAILDVIMPNKDGKEVYRELTHMRPDLKTLFMSGYTNDVVLEKRRTLDDRVGFIAKPMMLNELLHRVRQMLDRPR